MGIRVEDLRKLIIKPSLEDVGLYSKEAEELLLMTAAHESSMGYYLHQVGGPALGIFQMEELTHDDIWENYLKHRFQLWELVYDMSNTTNQSADEMGFNLRYATIMARLQYFRIPEPLPEVDDIWALARYAKEYWNTHLGAATVSDYHDAYKEYVK